MSLPPFEDLSAYASGNENIGNEGGDLPQRFYMTPEQEQLADWKLKVKDVILPVHSLALCLACKVYCDMATTTGAVVQDGPIPLEGCSLVHALAFLRLLYRADCLAPKPVAFLLKSGYLPGVLRLAHSLDWSLLDLLSKLAGQIIEAEIPADEYDIAPIAEAASDLKLESLRSACYSAVFELCKAMTSGFTEVVTFYGAAEVVDRLGDSPELLKAALFVALSRKDISGKSFRRLFDRKIELPSALFTWRCSIEELLHEESLESDVFMWNDQEFALVFYRATDENPKHCGVFLKLKDPSAEAGPKIEFKLRLVNWVKPKASVEMKTDQAFSSDEPDFGLYSFIERDDLSNFADLDGFITLQVADMRLVEGQQNEENGA